MSSPRSLGFLVACLVLLTFTGTVQGADSTECRPPVSIGDVRYLGKIDGNDRVKVAWTLGAGCLGSPGQTFTVKVKVTRRLGRVDEGTATQKTSSAPMETTITVPRGPLETDPQEFTVTITGSGAGNTSASAAAEATLAEASSAAGKSFAEPEVPANPCAMAAGFVKLAYKGQSGGKERIDVAWRAKSSCIKPIDGRVTVHVITSSGQASQSVTVPHPPSTATSNFNVQGTATVEVPASGSGAIVRFAASLSETGRTSEQVTATKSGKF